MSTEHTLAENLLRLQSATEDIADAITEKGGAASYSDGLEAMASKILSIPTPQPILTTKTIIQNGTYIAEDDNADGYSSIIANVPNTYSSSDNGKVVQNGVLVSQTSITKTENGTYDTTTNNSVTVNVPDSSSVINTGTVVNKNASYVNVTAKSYGKSIVIDGVFGSYGVSLGMSSNYHNDMFEITGLTIPNVSEIKAIIGYYTTNKTVSSSNSYSIGFITSLDTDYVYGTDPYNPRQRLQVIRYNASKLLIAWTIDANFSTRSYYGYAGCGEPFRVAIIF